VVHAERVDRVVHVDDVRLHGRGQGAAEDVRLGIGRGRMDVWLVSV
jgi:hypothetical protein